MKATKAFKPPRYLELNPLDHEITLEEDRNEEDLNSMTIVRFKFAETSGSICLNKAEAKKISKWFDQLEKSLK